MPPPLAAPLLRWYAAQGRHDLPWRQTRDPYPLWLAEVMLQQTRVETVKPYYARFLARFPNWQALASAPQDEVLALWSGLGYYARARNAQAAARTIMEQHQGRFPDTMTAATALSGVGRSTAAAVLASAYGQRQAILDANARRILIRYHAIAADPQQQRTLQTLWSLAESHTPAAAHDYNQAIQDLGALCCTPRRPLCGQCPLQTACQARHQGCSDTLPRRREKAQKPERQAWFALLDDGAGRILLEKQPQEGIWGGLWTLPQWPRGDESAAAALEAFSRTSGLALRHRATGPEQRHAFTHFTLRFQCIEAVLQGAELRAPAREQQWCTTAQTAERGLPAPVRRLLALFSSKRIG